LQQLATDPKRFPKKTGQLRDARAADLTVQPGVVWRAVFAIDEQQKLVRVISIGPHDEAYRDAGRRS
jgi:hypothetical protein